jgi:DNA-binding response OmpR family regulator
VNILLCEDNHNQRFAISELLKASGYQVDSYETVQAAIEALDPGRHHAVITDYHLKYETGCTLVSYATELGIPSVLITGAANRAELARSSNLGAAYILLKPFGMTDLLEKLQAAIDEGSTRGLFKRAAKKLKPSSSD